MCIASPAPPRALWSTDAEGRCGACLWAPTGWLPSMQGLAPAAWLASVACGADAAAAQVDAAMRRALPFHVEADLPDADGTPRRIVVSGLPGAAGGASYSGFVVDITEERQALETALRSAAEYRLLIENCTDLIAHCDSAGRYVSLSPSYERLIGWATHEVVGQPVTDFLHPDDRQAATQALLHIFGGGEPPDVVEVRKLHRDGHFVTVGTKACTVRDAAGRCIGAVLVSRDITRDKERWRTLEAMATHDTLTGLPNRAWINDRVGQMLGQCEDPAYTAVLFLDLNGFKAVNDTLGHAAGDTLLQQVAQRLQSCMRPGDAVARLGGDEFVVAAKCSDRGAAAAIAQRLVDSLDAPFCIAGAPVHIGAAIGITLAEPGTASTDLLFQRADTAMYKAKMRRDGGQHRFFDTGSPPSVAPR